MEDLRQFVVIDQIQMSILEMENIQWRSHTTNIDVSLQIEFLYKKNKSYLQW
jgi:hypothetical protein